MSSILDALEKLERTRPPTIEPVPVAVPPPRRTRVIVLVGSAFGAGAVLALGLLRSRPSVTPQVVPPPVEAPEAKQPPAEPVEPVATPPAPAAPAQEAIPPKPEPVSAPPPPQAAPPPPQAAPPPPDAAAPPAGTAAPAAATAPAADAPHAPAPEVLAAARPVPPPSPAGPRPWAQAAAPPPPPPPAEVTAPPRAAPVPTYAHLEPPAVRKPPAGAPAVRLSFLLYSPAPGRRTVALAIESRGLETLHEGETSNDGVEVVRILPDRVELGWNGEHFTVRARD